MRFRLFVLILALVAALLLMGCRKIPERKKWPVNDKPEVPEARR